ncbi:MAG: TIGR02281 family clan AA aspartic protease [Sphingomonadaceae bacterium]|nr:TIGR02281 family clan AA aspartic protease [Sphingomonadaceae bacterium]
MFNRLIVFVIGAGAAVGFLMPAHKAAPTPAAALVAPKADTPPPIDTVLNRASDGHFYVDAQVNDQTVRFLVDTGATGVALTGADAERLGMKALPGELEVVARGASGDVTGKFVTIHHIAVDQKEAFDVHGIVIPEGLPVSLLGQNFLAQVSSVSISGDKMTLR